MDAHADLVRAFSFTRGARTTQHTVAGESGKPSRWRASRAPLCTVRHSIHAQRLNGTRARKMDDRRHERQRLCSRRSSHLHRKREAILVWGISRDEMNEWLVASEIGASERQQSRLALFSG